jgi:hypothetical protein
MNALYYRLASRSWKPLDLVKALGTRIGAVFALVITLSIAGATSALAAAAIPTRCDLANAVKTTGDVVGCNLIGFAQAVGPYFVIGAIALFVLAAFTRKGSRFITVAALTVGGLLLLSVAPGIVASLVKSSC